MVEEEPSDDGVLTQPIKGKVDNSERGSDIVDGIIHTVEDDPSDPCKSTKSSQNTEDYSNTTNQMVSMGVDGPSCRVHDDTIVPGSSSMPSSPPTRVFGLNELILHGNTNPGIQYDTTTSPEIAPFKHLDPTPGSPVLTKLDSPFHSQELHDRIVNTSDRNSPLKKEAQNDYDSNWLSQRLVQDPSDSNAQDVRTDEISIETPPADRLNCDDKLRINISEDYADYTPHLTPESLLDFCRSPISVQQAGHITHSTPNTCNSLSLPSSRKRSSSECLTPPPSTKRMTLASQKQQRKKLSTAFRSPLINKLNTHPTPSHRSDYYSTPLSKDENKEKPSNTPASSSHEKRENITPRASPSVSSSSPRITSFTSSARASAQFKSPLRSPLMSKGSSSSPLLTSSTPSAGFSVSASRTIHSLEGQVTRLRRALKIRDEGEADKLQVLIEKWREAGREASWELWGMVREECNYEGNWATGNQGGYVEGQSESKTSLWDHNWGWDNSHNKRTLEPYGEEDNQDDVVLESPTKLENSLYKALLKGPAVTRKTMLPPTPRGAYFEQQQARNCESYEGTSSNSTHTNHVVDNESTHGDVKQRTLGALLTQLGIMHETLGWDEDEGDFVDRAPPL